mmetsp:Transcript_37232/g.119411  ORF Transcript_37232/g.119411 Transcript_37232/m.119411 type:complete len:361 (+) Transcript_37232:508-1590(+)
MLEDDAALWQFAHGASVLEGRRASCRRDLLAARGSFGGRWVEHHGDQIAGPDLAHKQLAAALVPVASRHEGAKPQVVGAIPTVRGSPLREPRSKQQEGARVDALLCAGRRVVGGGTQVGLASALRDRDDARDQLTYQPAALLLPARARWNHLAQPPHVPNHGALPEAGPRGHDAVARLRAVLGSIEQLQRRRAIVSHRELHRLIVAGRLHASAPGRAVATALEGTAVVAVDRGAGRRIAGHAADRGVARPCARPVPHPRTVGLALTSSSPASALGGGPFRTCKRARAEHVLCIFVALLRLSPAHARLELPTSARLELKFPRIAAGLISIARQRQRGVGIGAAAQARADDRQRVRCRFAFD